jgi:hypothetical protein
MRRQPKRRGNGRALGGVPFAIDLQRSQTKRGLSSMPSTIRQFRVISARRKATAALQGRFLPRVPWGVFRAAVGVVRPAAWRAFSGTPDSGPAMSIARRSIGAWNVRQESTGFPKIRPDSINTICYLLTRRQYLSCGHYSFTTWSNYHEELRTTTHPQAVSRDL